jgi:beta-lactamase regulating signal transducer with metallopeptidase domain
LWIRKKERINSVARLLGQQKETLMAIDNPQRPASSGAISVLVMILLAIVVVVTAVTLWRADNSGTNSLSGDPQATSPQSPQTVP